MRRKKEEKRRETGDTENGGDDRMTRDWRRLKTEIIKSNAQRPNVNIGLDTSQNKAVNLTGLIVTSANILG